MQSKTRIQKLNEAKRLLNNEPEPRAPKFWYTIDGVSPQPGYPEEVQPQDTVHHIEIVDGIKPKDFE
jgi:hypothetical protein